MSKTEAMKLMFSLEVIRLGIKMESKKKKLMIWICALVTAILCLVFAALYLARFNSVVLWQDAASNPDFVVYDTSCYSLAAVTGLSKTGGVSLGDELWTDPEEALSLRNEIAVDCDADCQKLGSRWSVIFILNGILLLLVLLNMCCVGVGAYVPIFRCLGACCAPWCCCAHFAIIVMTGVFRFSLYGRLCALSKGATNWTSKDDAPDDDWTYEKDGQLILALWILQILSFVCCCGVSCLPLRPSSPMQ